MNHRPSVLLAAAVVTVLGLSAGPRHAGASLVEALDLRELTALSNRVVIGEVLSVRSQWDKDHKRIFSTMEIQVAEVWKGTPPSGGRITVQQLGGSVGDIEMKVHGLSRFEAGERAVLFLAGGDRASSLVGLGQGRRPLRFDGARRSWMVDGGDRSAVVTVQPGGGFLPAPAIPAVTLETLRQHVRALVQR